MNIRMQNILKRYPRNSKSANYIEAVCETSCTIAEGCLTVLTGRSGSGKTTFLQMAGGMLEPTGGSIYAGDVDLYTLSDKALSAFRNAHIGVIPQGQAAIPSLSILENITLPRLLYRIRPETAEKDALSLMDRFDILNLKEARPGELSGGELRRMSIARGIINQPEILLADEPTGDLDDENSVQVLETFRSLANEGMTILLVTHEMDSLRFADHIWHMEKGILSIQSQKEKSQS